MQCQVNNFIVHAGPPTLHSDEVFIQAYQARA